MGRSLSMCCVIAAVMSCGEPGPAGPSDGALTARLDPSPVVRTAPSCAALHEAPLPDGFGGTRCLHVGADVTTAPRATPDVGGLPQPVIHVAPGTTGGDGSPERPLGSLAEGLARLAGGGTLALHRGEYIVTAPLTLPTGTTVVGVGPTGGTTLRVAVAQDCFVLSAGARVTVRDLAVRVEGATTRRDARGFVVPADASLTIDNVRVEGATTGIHASGAVNGTRLSVLGSKGNGINLFAPAVARFRSLLVRDGDDQAIVAGRAEAMSSVPGAARAHLIDAAVIHNARGGVVLVDDVVDGSGAGRCTEEGPEGGSGALDCLSRVSSQGNGRAGMVIQGRRSADVRLSSFSGTRAVSGAPDGEGVQLRDGARLTIDSSIRADVARGNGTLIVGNARVGVLAQGRAVVLELRGAQVNSNAGPGVLIGAGARAEVVGFCELRGNGGLGIGVTRTGSIAAVQCNGIAETRLAPLASTTGTMAMFGDGVAIDQGALVDIAHNIVSDNGRFGVVFERVSGSFTGNQGVGNAYGQGIYNSSGLVGHTTEQIHGNAPPPAEAPGFAADMGG